MSFKKILIIIQRSNGDVLLSAPLINNIKKNINPESIDLLVNDDTIAIAKILPHIANIYTFSYKDKKDRRINQEIQIVKGIFKNYDLSINLTSSDRSVIYASLAGKYSISAVEKNNSKSWWKKILLNNHYIFDNQKHILLNNIEPLNLINIQSEDNDVILKIDNSIVTSIKSKLADLQITRFIIFHPSAQYIYKIYPEQLRNKLLDLLNDLNIPIIVSGGSNKIDAQISRQIPVLDNIFNWIGKTSIAEYVALSSLSEAYIGMDTLNMHIAAAQNKRIFGIYGPTNLSMWAPWSNQLKLKKLENVPLQTYDNITIFQADLPCVACGKAGCNDQHGKSICLDHINPNVIFEEFKKWLNLN
jgi:heptosyltransferase III